MSFDEILTSAISNISFIHLQISLRLEPAGVVLSDAGVLALVLPLQLEGGQGSAGLVKLPSFESCVQ